jgi:predicted oxidoreductase
MVDGSFDYMQLNKIRPMSWNPLGFVFRKDIPQTHRLNKYATLVSKYHVGADTILLSWVLKHPKVIIAGTVNVSRIQSLIKAVELDLEKKIGLPSGQKAWVKMYLKLVQIAFLKKITRNQ